MAFHNINLAVQGSLPGAPPSITTCPVLMLRPRAWNMIEHNILVYYFECNLRESPHLTARVPLEPRKKPLCQALLCDSFHSAITQSDKVCSIPNLH